MKTLEPCKVVVFGGIKEFRLKLKSFGIDEILNDDVSIKESDVVLIVIDKVDEKFVATRVTKLSAFNKIDTKLISDNEIKKIIHIQNGQSIEDFKFDTNKIYYAKSANSEDGEYWLFEPKTEIQEKLTEHVKSLSVLNGVVDYYNSYSGMIMDDSDIAELRAATPEETRIYRDFWFSNKYQND